MLTQDYSYLGMMKDLYDLYTRRATSDRATFKAKVTDDQLDMHATEITIDAIGGFTPTGSTVITESEFGDVFSLIVDPTNPDLAMSSRQLTVLKTFNLKSGDLRLAVSKCRFGSAPSDLLACMEIDD